MTTMLERFFGIPQSVVRDGTLKAMSPCALKLYICLWHESERFSNREFTRTTNELIALVGGAPNSYAKARAELKKGLICAEPYGEEGFIYALCDPVTGKPWPGPSDQK